MSKQNENSKNPQTGNSSLGGVVGSILKPTNQFRWSKSSYYDGETGTICRRLEQLWFDENNNEHWKAVPYEE